MQALYAQLLVGLINGSFYALLSLGLAVIFGMLNIINFAHGAVYMLGAFVIYYVFFQGGAPYFAALVLAMILLGAFGYLVERSVYRPIKGGIDPTLVAMLALIATDRRAQSRARSSRSTPNTATRDWNGSAARGSSVFRRRRRRLARRLFA